MRHRREPRAPDRLCLCRDVTFFATEGSGLPIASRECRSRSAGAMPKERPDRATLNSPTAASRLSTPTGAPPGRRRLRDLPRWSTARESGARISRVTMVVDQSTLGAAADSAARCGPRRTALRANRAREQTVVARRSARAAFWHDGTRCVTDSPPRGPGRFRFTGRLRSKARVRVSRWARTGADVTPAFASGSAVTTLLRRGVGSIPLAATADQSAASPPRRSDARTSPVGPTRLTGVVDKGWRGVSVTTVFGSP